MTIQQTFDAAVRHHQAGQLAEAENLYRQILARQPGHADAMHFLGVIAHQMGRNDVAAELIGRAIALKPAVPEAYNNLGNVLKGQGLLHEAAGAFRKAIALKRGYPQAHSNLGNVLKGMGQLDEATAAYRQAIALAPNYPEAHGNLGSTLQEKGDLQGAIAEYRRFIALRPDSAEAFSNLGTALQAKGEWDQAIAAYRQAIALKRDYAEAWGNLGNALKDKGELDEAVAAQRQFVALRPESPESHSNLGVALFVKDGVGELDEAIAAYRRAIALRPNYPEAINYLGVALKAKEELDEAIAAYRRAIAIRPGYAEAHSNLGTALWDKREVDDAIAAYRQAIALKADFPDAYFNLGNALTGTGRLDEAIAAYRRAIALRPSYRDAHGNLAYTMHLHPGYDGRTIAEELGRWNRLHTEPLKKVIRPHLNDRNPDRRLRIGYVSPDFRDHVVGRNILPLIRGHDRSQFEIACYAQVTRPDGMTGQFRQNASRWRSLVNLSDEQAAEQIRQDEIDILVDLSLHTAGNRLLVFARKPAPVQVTFAGYPGSTGLTAIDYRLSDPYLDPPGMDESIYSERTVRLPDSFWCYDPLDCRDIAVNRLPVLEDPNVVTFGCLNNFCKITDATLDLWAQVLRQIPGSRLLLLTYAGSHRQRTVDRLGQEQIDSGRIQFIPRLSRRGYLEQYRHIDIGLDTFPYNGHTTSLDSLWMGVPVITLVGQTAVSRAGWCQLSNLGLTELAGQTREQFVRIAVELAADLPRLKELRSTLRRRMEQSPLMDAPRFARNIEAAYRRMWQTWCAM